MRWIQRKSILFLHLLLQTPRTLSTVWSLQVHPGQTFSIKWSTPVRAYWKLSAEMSAASSIHWEENRKQNPMPALKINYKTFLFYFTAVNSHQGLTQKFYVRLGSTVLSLAPHHCFLSSNCFLNEDLQICIVREKYQLHFEEGKGGEDNLWLAFGITKNVTKTWEWSI